MRALLLAAGKGTRLRPLTDTLPKCLVPIHERPLLGHWFDLLFDGGVERVIVNTHHLAHQVEKYVSESPWQERIELFHEETLLGTGGTVLHTRSFFRDQAFMVVHADNLSHFDVNAFVDRHQNRPPGVEITMMTFETDTPHTCGIVSQNEAGIVTHFHEKVSNPPGNRANGAVYIFEPSVLDFLSALNMEFIDLSIHVIPQFIGRICTFHNADYHRDIGTPRSLELAENEYPYY